MVQMGKLFSIQISPDPELQIEFNIPRVSFCSLAALTLTLAIKIISRECCYQLTNALFALCINMKVGAI